MGYFEEIKLLKIMVMRYFQEIKFWKIALLNVSMGFLMSVPVLFGLIVFFGSSGPSTISEKISGLGILLVVLLIIVLTNYGLWKISKKNTKADIEIRNKKITYFKLATLLVIILISIGSFFIPFF